MELSDYDSAPEDEFERKLMQSDLVKPFMRGDIDLTLMSMTELKIEAENMTKHDEIINRRADELTFYPETLTEEEYWATFRCLSYKELKPYYKVCELHEKNRRLQKNLSLMEKISVRLYFKLTVHFSNCGPVFRKYPEEAFIGLVVKDYFEIMREHDEKVYENPFYFVSEERKNCILEAYAKFREKRAEEEKVQKKVVEN